MKNKKLTLMIMLSLVLSGQTNSAIQAFIIIDNQDIETEDNSLVGWFDYLNNNCTSDAGSILSDLSSWELASNIDCQGTEKNLPTAADLTGFTGDFSIGSSTEYYTVIGDTGFSGIENGSNFSFYLNGDDFKLNNYTGAETTFNIGSIYIDPDNTLDTIDLEDVNIGGAIISSTSLSTIGTINSNLNTDDRNYSQLFTTLLDVTNKLSSDDTSGAFIGQGSYLRMNNLEITKDYNSSYDSTNNIASFYYENLYLKNLNIDNTYVSKGTSIDTNLIYFPELLTTSYYFLNGDYNMDNVILNNSYIDDLQIENFVEIENLSITNSDVKTLSLEGSYTADVPSKINNYTIKSVNTSKTIDVIDVKELGVVKYENINVGNTNTADEFFLRSFGPEYYTDNSISSIYINNIYTPNYGSIKFNYYDIIGDLNINGSEFNVFEITPSNVYSVSSRKLDNVYINDSIFNEYFQIGYSDDRAYNIETINIDSTTFNSSTQFFLQGTINNVDIKNSSFDLFTYIEEADYITNVDIDNSYFSSQLEIGSNIETTDINITNTDSIYYMKFENPKNITMNNVTLDNFLYVEKSSSTLDDLNMTIDNVEFGYLDIGDYDNYDQLIFNDILSNGGSFLSGNYSSYSDIDTLTMNNYMSENTTDIFSLTEIENIENLTINTGTENHLIRYLLQSLSGKINNLSIINNHPTETLYFHARVMNFDTLKGFESANNITIYLTDLGTTTPFTDKMSATSVFCLGYGTSNEIIGSSGTVDKDLICD